MASGLPCAMMNQVDARRFRRPGGHMSNSNLPPPFIVGQKYYDHEGEYTVISTDGDRVTLEHLDGRLKTAGVMSMSRIHRNIVIDRNANQGSGRDERGRKRREPTPRESGLIERILRLEADGADHSGVEIDQLLEDAARELGYSDEELSKRHSKTGRTVFGNLGDFVKGKITEEGWHEVVGTTAHSQSGARRTCQVYRITPRGLEELRKRG